MSRQVAQRFGFLNTKNTLFLLCDVQEKFRPAIKNFDSMVKNTQKLVSRKKVQVVLIIVLRNLNLNKILSITDWCWKNP